MADATHIEWTDATWNIITGCSVVSPGCTNCYAMRLAGTRMKRDPTRQGLTTDSKAGPVWNGQVRFNTHWLTQPLKWKRPRKIFVCAHGDLFHEAVPDAWLDQIFVVMAQASQHTFQVLTKRPERMRDYIAHLPERRRMLDCNPGLDFIPTWPLPNVWLGVSVEDQVRADERIPILLDTPAAVRWISAEPLLGPIRFKGVSEDRRRQWDYLTGETGVMYPDGPDFDQGPKLDQVIVGGESGPKARPMDRAWVRPIRDHCAASRTAFLFKQWGVFLPDGEQDVGEVVWDAGTDCPKVHRWPDGSASIRIGKEMAGRRLDGVMHDGYPS